MSVLGGDAHGEARKGTVPGKGPQTLALSLISQEHTNSILSHLKGSYTSDLLTADAGLEPLWKLLKPEVLSTPEDGMWAEWVQESKDRIKTWEPLGTARNPHKLAGGNTG